MLGHVSFVFQLSPVSVEIERVSKINNLLAGLNFCFQLQLPWLLTGTLHFDLHDRSRRERGIKIVIEPEVPTIRSNAVNFEHLVARLESLGLRITLRFDRDDVAILAEALHLPSVFDPGLSLRW